MTTKFAYKYSDLGPRRQPAATAGKGCNRVRLLTLLPGVSGDEITVTLRMVSLDALNHTKYEALSYVWGSEKEPIAITVGRRWSLNVSRNLAVALKHLRFEVEPRVLWVDAICINQEDLQERAQQVGFMGDIYRRAWQVVVWLGPEENDSTCALDFVNTLNRVVSVNWWNGTMGPAIGTEMMSLWQADHSISFSAMVREGLALSALLDRPWFQRVWIRQEIFLAKKAIVQCGHKEILWAALKNTAFCISEKNFYFGPLQMTLDRSNVFRERLALVQDLGRERPDHLLGVLKATMASKCKDPRDRVYGVLNMLDPRESNAGIIPDYTLSAAEVYRNLVVHFIAHYKSLDILSYTRLERPRSRVIGLPSWVPDWTAGQVWISTGYFNAGGYLAPQTTIIGSHTLRVSGVPISHIAELFPSVEDGTSWESMYRAIPQMLPSSQRSLRAYGGSEPLVEAYCRVLCRNNFSDKVFPSKDEQRFTEAMKILLDILGGSTEKRENITKAEQRFLSVATIGSGIICTSEDGHIGYVPKSAKVGDLLCVLPGCRSVIVLRPAAGQVNCYSVVGDAFLDKMMNIEALLGPLPDGYVAVWKQDSGGNYYSPAFLDTSTMKFLLDDPRLGAFAIERNTAESSSWEEAKSLLKKVTPQMLRDGGVQLEDFDLV
jgi:hypothetical protein